MKNNHLHWEQKYKDEIVCTNARQRGVWDTSIDTYKDFWVCIVAGFLAEVKQPDLVIQVYWVRCSHHHHHHHHTIQAQNKMR